MAEAGVIVSYAVEGDVDAAVLRRLLTDAGARPGPVYGRKGKAYLLQRLESFNRAAQYNRWLVLLDLDEDADCAPPFRSSHMPIPARYMCFRIAVRQVEAWLLADRERIAASLSVPMARIPGRPEELADPKLAVVNLARRSRRRAIREGVPPRPGSGRKVGPLYTSYLSEFATQHWRPGIAAGRSDSLKRCRQRLIELLENAP